MCAARLRNRRTFSCNGDEQIEIKKWELKTIVSQDFESVTKAYLCTIGRLGHGCNFCASLILAALLSNDLPPDDLRRVSFQG